MRRDIVSGSDDLTDRHRHHPGDRIENIDWSGWRKSHNFGPPELWSRDMSLLQLIASVMISRGWLKSEDRQRLMLEKSFRNNVTLEFVPGKFITFGQFLKEPEQYPRNVGFVYSADVRVEAFYRDSDGDIWQIQDREVLFAGVRTPIESFADMEYAFVKDFGCLMDGFEELQRRLQAAANACVPLIKKPVLVLAAPVFGPAGNLLIDVPVAIETEGQMRVFLEWLRLAEAAALDEDDERQNTAVRYENGFLYGLEQAEFDIPNLPETSDS